MGTVSVCVCGCVRGWVGDPAMGRRGDSTSGSSSRQMLGFATVAAQPHRPHLNRPRPHRTDACITTVGTAAVCARACTAVLG